MREGHLLWIGEVVVDLFVEDVEDHVQEVPAERTKTQRIQRRRSPQKMKRGTTASIPIPCD